MAELVSRRRAIAIIAAFSGLPLVPLKASANSAIEPVTWSGQALGAPARLVLHHPDRQFAEKLIGRVVSEIDRLESIFSLYRSHSALNELNRVGGLASPASELVDLLGSCRNVWEASAGAFDPTVQALWSVYARHFSSPVADNAGPPQDVVDQGRARVGFDGVRFNRDRITFTRAGMAMTLNGIAQGYITDRVVDLLRGEGITSSLVSMGESRVIGARPDGAPWRIGLATLEDSTDFDSVVGVIDSAVATSSSLGFHFDEAGRFGHILDPRTGYSAATARRVTVVAPDATMADAWSTAASILSIEEVKAAVARYPSVTFDIASRDGSRARFGKPLIDL